MFVSATRGAADEFISLTCTRIGANSGKAAAVKPVAQMRVGWGEARTKLVETLLADLIASAMASDAPVRFDVPGRLALKARTAAIVEHCKDTLNDLAFGAGANALRAESKMQMIFRGHQRDRRSCIFRRTGPWRGLGA